MKEDLVYLRHKIQKIDEKIQDLFLKRIEYILHVKAIKIKQNLPETKQMICFTYNELIYAIFKTQS